MTVSSSTNKVSYNGNGSTTVFAYTFKIFDEDDLTVIIRDASGTETTQTITTHYTVSGVGNAGGGNVTMLTAPASGETLTILREQDLLQGLDLVPNDPFPAQSLEDALDKLVFMVQQHDEELARTIKASKTNTITSTEFTVSAADRANKIFAFDGSGELSVTQELGTFRGDWAASTAFAARDIVKDTSNNNIYIANTSHTSSGTTPISSNADSAKWDLLVDAAAATTSATNAASSASAAATSATNAANSATAAATSESNAASSASTASTQATNAAGSATAAAASASAAAASETAAATSETNAGTSETNAATSASNAATSASNASTSETNAASSASTASTAATTATTQATNAATSASAAATAQTAAETAQTAAETAQTAAETAQAAAEAAADNFDDTYLGAFASDPTTDNDGDPLTTGDLYFNTTSNELKVYNGSAWQVAAVSAAGLLTAANNLSDLANAATARTNLGVEIGVDVQAYDADTAKLDVAQTFTAAQRGSTDTDTTNTGTVTLDFAANQNFVLTLTGNVTLANPTTEQVGQSGFIVFIQDATGGRTVSLGTDYETAGGAGLTLSSTASTTDVVPYIVAASGRILLGAPQLAFA